MAPASSIEKWCREFEQFLAPVSTIRSSYTAVLDTDQNQGTVRVLALRDPSILPTTLINFDVIICLYQFMVSKYQRMTKDLANIASINKTGLGNHPDRKNIALYSGIYHVQATIQSPLVIFDESSAFAPVVRAVDCEFSRSQTPFGTAICTR
jgi:hypothetical protein